jgi:hypothetical protein
MIKKTDPSIQPSLSKSVNYHLQSIRNIKEGAMERTLDKTSALLDLFFIVRLFENFTVIPNQPSGPITRVIAYVGVAHVGRIEKVLKNWARNSDGVVTYKDQNSYVTPLNGKAVSLFNIAQCITIPLQVVHRQSPETETNPYGSSLVLPESLEYVDIDRRPAIYRDESRKYVIDDKLQLLNIDMDMSVDKNKKRYQRYLSLPMYLQSRFNTLLERTKQDGGSENIFELLDNKKEDIPELMDAIELSFSFGGKKKTKKSVKKAKKSVKKNKKSVKKNKKSVKKNKKSVKKSIKKTKKSSKNM